MSRILVRIALLGLGALALFLAVAVAFLAGHLSGRDGGFLHAEMTRVESVWGRAARAREGADIDYAAEYDSIFLRLQAEGLRIPVPRAGAGGALTGMGDDVLVLTHDGQLFLSHGPRDLRRPAITLPDNGFDAYLRVAESAEFSDYRHEPAFLRYNDVLFVPGAGGGAGGGVLLLSYTEFDAARTCYRTAVARLDVQGSDAADVTAGPDDWTVIYRTAPCLPLKRERRAIEGHVAGGRMTFAAPGTLYLANGDYHWDGVRGPEALAQRADADYGKVVAIDLASGAARHVSSGHRNPQGIALDRAGQLWVAEHGPRGGDELNRIVEGANFGWPLVTLGTSYDGSPWPTAITPGRHSGFAAPTHAWLPAIAPSALARAEGFDQVWDGDLLLATLADQSLHRLRIVDERVKFAERIEVGKRLRDVLQHHDGRLVLWTDDRYLIFVRVLRDDGLEQVVSDHIAAQVWSEAQREQILTALDRCQFCHVLRAGPGDMNAPDLAGIYGAPAASTAFQWYSRALSEHAGRWTRDALAAYLADPEVFMPGTVKTRDDLDTAQIMAVIDILAALASATE